MIDLLKTLGPSGGIADWFTVLRPEPPAHPLWRVIVRLRGTGDESAPPPSARVVGAYGHSRGDALTRGAGEAVERYALHPPGAGAGRRGRAADLGAAALPFCDPDIALGDPRARRRELSWYPARRLRDDAEILVPAALVDWPAAPSETPFFDPGPSGAASGRGHDMALRNALLEMVERDAVMVAWELGLRPPRTALPSVLAALDADRDRRALERMTESAARSGATVFLATVPTGVAGVSCAIAGVADEGPDTLAAVGCRASGSPGHNALTALQEALQVRSLLTAVRGGREGAAAPEAIGTEDERSAYLTSRRGAESVCDWLRAFTAEEPVAPTAAVSTKDLVSGLIADGADPLVVDLTHRLPVVLRDMGWAAVKVIPVGYQHLRMDERKTWSWNARRLKTAESRTGLAARFAAGTGDRPHPLP